jgi:hypothetical protein
LGTDAHRAEARARTRIGLKLGHGRASVELFNPHPIEAEA